MVPKDTMDIKQLSEYLHVDEDKIYNMANERSIPALKVENTWVFSKKSIDKWMRMSSKRRKDS